MKISEASSHLTQAILGYVNLASLGLDFCWRLYHEPGVEAKVYLHDTLDHRLLFVVLAVHELFPKSISTALFLLPYACMLQRMSASVQNTKV